MRPITSARSVCRYAAVIDWPASLGAYPNRSIGDAEIDAYVGALINAVGGLPAECLDIGAPIPGRRANGSPCITIGVYAELAHAGEAHRFAALLRRGPVREGVRRG